MITRIVVAPKGKTRVYKIYYLEIADNSNIDLSTLYPLFHDEVVEQIIKKMPKGKFLEVMYHNGVVDPEQEAIIIACRALGVEVEAAKVAHRYYGRKRKGVFVNKLVHMSFTKEPVLDTLKPRGTRKGMLYFNLLSMSDAQLMSLSKDRDLNLSLRQMKMLAHIQQLLGGSQLTDVTIETFAARWSSHCFHTQWKALGLFKILQEATRKINNPNLVSAFIDNAGGWKFFAHLAACLKLETHCSPSQQEPYGGQLTKLGGVIRDIIMFALGAYPIGNFELTVVGEFLRKKFPELEGKTLDAQTIARETIRAIRDYGNPMGIPMLIARMLSHPNFGGKVFALGGTAGITTRKAAEKGVPCTGDLVMMAGGLTGNDGLHGATVSSGQLSDKTDTGDACHVQIGNPFPEQKTMLAFRELLKKRCIRAMNDFGAAGVVSAIAELGENVTNTTGKLTSGVLINLALIRVKCLGLENWQLALSESQERFALVIPPNKLKTAIKILRRYQLEATVVGVITGNKRLQLIYDPEATNLTADSALSGEIALDIPYEYFDLCPLPEIEVIEPPKPSAQVLYPKITLSTVQEITELVAKHFDVCNQQWATMQYDSTVQGRTYQGPLYGRNYNIPTHLGVLKPVYGKNWGLTFSQSCNPRQFEANSVQAAINAMLDAIVSQVIAGVKIQDICLADNFYTPNLDPYAYWYLINQVRSIADLSVELGTPFITGKDSSSGSSKFGDFVINVLPIVCITAMGKIRNADNLHLHQWKAPGNLLYTVGPQAKHLDGSILASALDQIGTQLDGVKVGEAIFYIKEIERLANRDIIQSAVPINRGGIFMRVFEGIVATDFGVKTEMCEGLFPESYGAAIIEVQPNDAQRLERQFKELNPMIIGTITPNAGLWIQGKELDFSSIFRGWNTTLEREVTQ